MSTKKLLLDTGVWISYFGDRPVDKQKQVNHTKEIINYCLAKQIKLFYCPYVENELSRGDNANRAQNIKKMKKIANQLLAQIGNDTWDQVDIKWEEWGEWPDDQEVKLANDLQKQLPDKKKKPNRIDRNIIITALHHKIDFILHENPKDYNKIKNDEIKFIDLTSIESLDKFIQIITN